VAIGLAWTTLGGEIMYVEATQMTGDGKLTLTGQLGDVMKESANLAMNWLRSNARRVSELVTSTLSVKRETLVHNFAKNFPNSFISSSDGITGDHCVTNLLLKEIFNLVSIW